MTGCNGPDGGVDNHNEWQDEHTKQPSSRCMKDEEIGIEDPETEDVHKVYQPDETAGASLAQASDTWDEVEDCLPQDDCADS